MNTILPVLYFLRLFSRPSAHDVDCDTLKARIPIRCRFSFFGNHDCGPAVAQVKQM